MQIDTYDSEQSEYLKMSNFENVIQTDKSTDTNDNVILSIVIPSFNRAKLLSRCLCALENQSAKKTFFEITVADDGSTDETLEMLEKFKPKTGLKLQWTSIKNSGPAMARNTGVSISSGPWIGFLDADVIPHPNWVETTLELIRNNPKAGAFEGRTEVTQRGRATPFTHQTENTKGGRYPTCNLIVRKKLAHFHNAYKIPFREDTDLAFSILESGYSIIFAFELVVEHPPLESTFFRPFILAQRYYYDGLLARRFPTRYHKELDAHIFLGLKIPHLKRKLYSIFMLSQIIFLTGIVAGFSGSEIIPIGVSYLTIFAATAAGGLRYANLKKLSFKDWLLYFLQLQFLPWVMSYSLFRGWIDFRHERKFTVF